MSERLIIRLASEASQKQHWLIWSDKEKEIIASGEVENAEQLNILTEKAFSRHVICLLPGVDVCIKEVQINGAFNKQMQQALPYLIEEELACDVEALHFTLIAKHVGAVHIAICDKQRIITWLAWLADAQIVCKQFIPEGLTLPCPSEDNWQAVQLGQHWIVRESKNIAWSCDDSMLDIVLSSKIESENNQVIESYSPISANQLGQWKSAAPTLPMELLTAGTISCKINLLHGEFKAKKTVNKNLQKWQLPLIFVGLLFVMSCINIYMEVRQTEQQIIATKAQVEHVYSTAFPQQKKLKYNRIKKKLKTMLSEVKGHNGPSDFLVMLSDIAPIFKMNKQLMPKTLKYDAKKQEMRILVVGDNFQAFEKFSNALPKQYSLQQGALNSSKNQVSGQLTIGKK